MFLSFQVQRIKIHNDSSCSNVREPNPFCIPNVDVSNFLNLHSKSNHEEFCLAYVFTYRDFTGGTLGLAWVASATGENCPPRFSSFRLMFMSSIATAPFRQVCTCR